MFPKRPPLLKCSPQQAAHGERIYKRYSPKTITKIIFGEYRIVRIEFYFISSTALSTMSLVSFIILKYSFMPHKSRATSAFN